MILPASTPWPARRRTGRSFPRPGILAALCVCTLVFGLAPAAFAINMQEGEWESNMETVMESMPFPIPPVKVTQCMTKSDLVPGKEENKNCTVTQQQIIGNTLRWKISCREQEGLTEGSGEVTYSGKTYQGSSRMVMTDRTGKKMRVSVKMSGRYLGPCTGKGPTVNGVRVDDMQKQAQEMQDRARAAQGESKKREQQAWREYEQKRPNDQSEPGIRREMAGPDAASPRGIFGNEAEGPAPHAGDAMMENPAQALRGLFGF